MTFHFGLVRYRIEQYYVLRLDYSEASCRFELASTYVPPTNWKNIGLKITGIFQKQFLIFNIPHFAILHLITF